MQMHKILKRPIIFVIVMTMFIINIVGSAYASDTYRRISSIRITVSDYLKHYDYDVNGSTLPTLSESDFSVPENNQYDIENVSWYGDNSYSIGSVPYVEIYLSAGEKERNSDNYTYYYFSGYYDSSSVVVNGGSFVSATLVGNYAIRVVIALNNVKGTYAAPSSPMWSSAVLGRATWTAPNTTSGYYKVDVFRENIKVASIITDQTAINLYPYMTKSAAYYFQVCTTPYNSSQKGVGKESEVVQSAFLNIGADQISDGSGQYTDSLYILNTSNTNINGTASNTSSHTSLTTATGFNSGTEYTVYNASTGQTTTLSGYGGNINNTNTNNANIYYGTNSNNGNNGSATTGSWYKEGNYWYFKTADGNKVCNDWLFWKNAYYRFGNDGKMITGFYGKDDYSTYYLSNSGAMKTGWVLVNNAWYYLNPQPGEYYGLMYKNMIVTVGDKSYFFDIDGRMRTGWVIIKDSDGIDQYYYFYTKSNEHPNDYGYMAKDTTILNGYTIADDGHWVH